MARHGADPRRFPTHGVAHVAVRRLVQHAEGAGPSAALDELRRLQRDLEGTELVQLVAFLAAEHLEASGDDRGAREAYGRIADRWAYPFGPFFDDSLWHASLIDEKLGLYQLAIDDLERLLRERETTIMMGSYERPKYVPAMVRVESCTAIASRPSACSRGVPPALHRFRALDPARPRPWLEAALWREDGDAKAACNRLGTLVEKFPDSRYVPCAVEQCPGLARPPRSVAPRECHEYIARTTGRAEYGGDGD